MPAAKVNAAQQKGAPKTPAIEQPPRACRFFVGVLSGLCVRCNRPWAEHIVSAGSS